MKLLLLLRHGIAEDQGPGATDDSRRLTDEGIEKTTAVTQALARFVDRPDLILASPKTRALQTARIAAQAFNCDMQTLDLLGDNDPHTLINHVIYRNESCLMLVGHEPSFSAATELLCNSAWEGYINLKKAGCICLELINDPEADTVSAMLLWITTPKMVLALSSNSPQ